MSDVLAGLGGDPLPGAPPQRSRGAIALDPAACTVCMLCARECPDWCLFIDSHKQTVEQPGARPRVVAVLDRFAIDWSLCMWCGICVDVCPFDALFWTPELAPAESAVADLLHERDRLTALLPGVPERAERAPSLP